MPYAQLGDIRRPQLLRCSSWGTQSASNSVLGRVYALTFPIDFVGARSRGRSSDTAHRGISWMPKRHHSNTDFAYEILAWKASLKRPRLSAWLFRILVFLAILVSYQHRGEPPWEIRLPSRQPLNKKSLSASSLHAGNFMLGKRMKSSASSPQRDTLVGYATRSINGFGYQAASQNMHRM